MAITGKEFVDFAYGIVKERSDLSEVEFRTVVNRAYYGAHHEAREVARIVDYSGNCHTVVIEHYKRKQNYVYNTLANLFKARKRADYEINSNLIPANSTRLKEARTYCNQAKKVLELLPSKK